MNESQWILCPICQHKTRVKIMKETVIKNFPLFCPKCNKETLINVKQFKMEIIKK